MYFRVIILFSVFFLAGCGYKTYEINGFFLEDIKESGKTIFNNQQHAFLKKGSMYYHEYQTTNQVGHISNNIDVIYFYDDFLIEFFNFEKKNVISDSLNFEKDIKKIKVQIEHSLRLVNRDKYYYKSVGYVINNNNAGDGVLLKLLKGNYVLGQTFQTYEVEIENASLVLKALDIKVFKGKYRKNKLEKFNIEKNTTKVFRLVNN